MSNSLCSLLCLPAPFKRLVCDLESQAYGCEVFLDLLSQIGSDYSTRPPTVSELWLLLRQVAAIAFCNTRRRKPICPVEKIVNVLRVALGMLCPFGRLQSFVVLRKQSKVSDYFLSPTRDGIPMPIKAETT